MAEPPPIFTTIQPHRLDREQEKPPEEALDKILFVVNDIAPSNFESKLAEIKGHFYSRRFANYLAGQRVSIEPKQPDLGSERAILTNIGSSLGSITLARDCPIKHENPRRRVRAMESALVLPLWKPAQTNAVKYDVWRKMRVSTLMITNSGSQRFDVYSGPFVLNDQLTSSLYANPFLSEDTRDKTMGDTATRNMAVKGRLVSYIPDHDFG
uniref:Triacylglycerol lipase n=1 Tax=Ganoderma boninense TaxID=34458 RepID=A0A5K1K3Q1_9APHY|nr:Triacylglycerol lipase [Ganoderma boninense]